MDAVSDMISSLEASGQIVLTESYQPPWAIEIPEAKALRSWMALPRGSTAVPFHMVRRGNFELRTSNGESRLVREGEAALCFAGLPHTMSNGQFDSPTPFKNILDGTVRSVGAGGIEGATELICGVFVLANIHRNPLIQSLPGLVVMNVNGSKGNRSLGLLADLLTDESQYPRAGSAFMSERLVELFCAEVVRSQVWDDRSQDQSWLRAMADEKIGTSLNIMHSDVGENHSVSTLAASVGMSPSRFAARFRSKMGISPMRYLRSWRMTKATSWLSSTNRSLADISSSLGYENVSAFCRTFKAETGITPASVRKS